MQKFNIIKENGCLYEKVIVLSNKGIARNVRDVRSAIKYEGGITLLGKGCMNEFISAKEFYEVEEVISYKEVILDDNDEDEEIEEDDI